MSVENRNFFPFRTVFCVPAEGVSLELVIDEGVTKLEYPVMGLPGKGRSLTISSAVQIQYTNVTDRQTDIHRPTAKTALSHSVAR